MTKYWVLAAAVLLAALAALALMTAPAGAPPEATMGTPAPGPTEAGTAASPEPGASKAPSERFISCPGHPRCPKKQEAAPADG